MRSELASLNHRTVPFLSSASANCTGTTIYKTYLKVEFLQIVSSVFLRAVTLGRTTCV